MTDQKYKIGDKVLIDATVEDLISPNRFSVSIYGNFYAFKAEQLRPYTPKPEFEYGEMVEVRDREENKWLPFVFLTEIKNANIPFIVAKDLNDLKKLNWYCFKYCRKLQPKKDLIEIDGKKYDAEKVKERLAGLNVEE